MRPRTLALLVGAGIILLLCIYKSTRTYPTQKELEAKLTPAEQLAPAIELLDQNKPSELVRLRRHLDHAQVLVVFFDGEKGIAHSDVLLSLREQYPALKKSGIEVMGISTALPQQNRAAIEQIGPFPFPLLSDPDYRVHHAWGRIDAATKAPMTGIFLVSRAGRVAWSSETNTPVPISEAATDIRGFVKHQLNPDSRE